MASTIGIKIANGEFYSIVEENSRVKKRLVLTTVHDKQRSVQIDLYRSYARSMADALYIGSLVVENIKPKPKGEPSIELVIASSPSGEIIADAVDLDASARGEHHTLNVSLKSLDEDNREYDIPDFELEQNDAPPIGLYGKAKEVREEEKRAFPWLAVVLAALILAGIGIALWLFLFRPGRGDASSSRPRAGTEVSRPESAGTAPAPAPAQTTAPEAAAPPPPPPAPPPVVKAPETPPPPPAVPASRERPAPPVASYRVPANIPREGAPYRIRWGDTLWDISEAFYRNPWLYPRIARFNNIRNPDLIISGRTIRIPPRN